jgi:hypothetical protein
MPMSENFRKLAELTAIQLSPADCGCTVLKTALESALKSDQVEL